LSSEILEGPYQVTLAIGDKYAHLAFLGVGKAINFATLPVTPVLGAVLQKWLSDGTAPALRFSWIKRS
jgi:hypothetical protein